MKNETNKLKYVIRNPGDMKSVRLQLRTTPKISKWMKDRQVSPTLVFDNAIKELMADSHYERLPLIVHQQNHQRRELIRLSNNKKEELRQKRIKEGVKLK